MTVYVFGNGNLSFVEFLRLYTPPLWLSATQGARFVVCDFRGVDTLAMELLKSETHQVDVHHVGEQPRYLPDRFGTRVARWNLVGGFSSDRTRDDAAIAACTHFLAFDFNSNETRKSGTAKNIERCLALGKTRLE